MHLEHLGQGERDGRPLEAVVEGADAPHVGGGRRGVGASVDAEDPLGVEGEHVGLASVAEEVVAADAVAVEHPASGRVLEGLAAGF